MSKDKVWKVGSAVFLLLIFCSVLSGKIQQMMRISVWTTSGELRQEEDLEVVVLPTGCVNDEEYPIVYYLVQEGGIFQTEWRVAAKPIVIVAEVEGGVAIPSENMKDLNGNFLEVIYYSAYPIREGDVVMRGEELE